MLKSYAIKTAARNHGHPLPLDTNIISAAGPRRPGSNTTYATTTEVVDGCKITSPTPRIEYHLQARMAAENACVGFHNPISYMVLTSHKKNMTHVAAITFYVLGLF